jgi:hypothetical protein
MSETFYKSSYDEDFRHEFDPSDADERERIGDSMANVERVVSNGHVGYVAYFDEYHDQREQRAKAGCRVAMELGANVPATKIGDSWIALKEFPGKMLEVNGEHACSEVLSNIDRELLCWETAKMVVLGHHDATPRNVMITDEGDFEYIDLQSLGIEVSKQTQLFVMGMSRLVQLFRWDPDWYREIERMAVALSVYLDESGYLSDEPTYITHNIKSIPKLFPIGEPCPNPDELDLPVIDNRVLPIDE